MLTQNTNWSNVEKAIANLRAENCLTLKKIAQLSTAQIAGLIRPAGYFNIKARRLKATAQFFTNSKILDYFQQQRQLPNNLRDQLLAVYGIGRETADSILLYAFQRPIFVVDAYTKRWAKEFKLPIRKFSYYNLQKFFMNLLPKKFHSGLLSFEIIWLILVFSISGLLLFYQPHQWSDAFRVILSLIL
ncbi:MAG: hypothetical protein N2246_07415, partial [Candidatus Sumerlaeia bacterium]|nr:hypothetical protein [Candidatus Sumerlaeia bacterium]